MHFIPCEIPYEALNKGLTLAARDYFPQILNQLANAERPTSYTPCPCSPNYVRWYKNRLVTGRSLKIHFEYDKVEELFRFRSDVSPKQIVVKRWCSPEVVRPKRAARPTGAGRPTEPLKPMEARRSMQTERPVMPERQMQTGTLMMPKRPMQTERPVTDARSMTAATPMTAESPMPAAIIMTAAIPLSAAKLKTAAIPMTAEVAMTAARPMTATRPMVAERPMEAECTPSKRKKMDPGEKISAVPAVIADDDVILVENGDIESIDLTSESDDSELPVSSKKLNDPIIKKSLTGNAYFASTASLKPMEPSNNIKQKKNSLTENACSASTASLKPTEPSNNIKQEKDSLTGNACSASTSSLKPTELSNNIKEEKKPLTGNACSATEPSSNIKQENPYTPRIYTISEEMKGSKAKQATIRAQLAARIIEARKKKALEKK